MVVSQYVSTPGLSSIPILYANHLIQCRSRRVKCDEGRPSCSLCQVSGFTCGGYTKDIFFDFEDDPLTGVARFRRPLLTEEERESMSQKLIADVPPKLATWSILQIDDECDRAPTLDDVQVSRGPFGAFRIVQRNTRSPSPPNLPTLLEFDSAPSPEQELELIAQDSAELPNVLSPSVEVIPFSPRASQNLNNQSEIFEEAHQHPADPWLKALDALPLGDWLDMAGQLDIPQFWDGVGMGSTNFIPATPVNRHPSGPLQPSELYPPISDDIRMCFDLPDNSPDQNLSTPSSGPGSLYLESHVPHDAIFLLKHYGSTVLRGLTPYRHSKTPWHVLFLPHVKSCLAALTLGEVMDHASLCAFFGTLAISSFSLGGIHASSRWIEQGKGYHHQARLHVRQMLDGAYKVPKRAKYKSILMALLTMVQISILFGNRDEAEYYLLETEKFIRVRGLNRRKSRKVRLLHHCYVYERLSHESTFAGSKLHLAHRHQVREAIESSGAGAYSSDSLSFQLSTWSNLDQEMLREKCQEEGENDLHLQRPGTWSATLYPEIFGVPEVYLFMMSLIIRLGQEKDGEPKSASAAQVALKEFLGRAKAVEQWISRLQQLRASMFMVDAPVDPKHEQSVLLLSSLSDTMQHALAVYFYRRVYDLDPNMLQKSVVGVRDCLLQFDAADAGMGYGSLRLIWPAFIAACEAEDVGVRASFADWFDGSAQRSGLYIFTETKERVERAWEERRNIHIREVV